MQEKIFDKNFAITVMLYVISAVILTFYGIHVCPFLESLPHLLLTLIILCSFAVALIARTISMYFLQKHEPKLKDPWHHLIIDLSSWVFAGVLVTTWNTSMYNFPLVSGAKVILGCLTLGIFSSLFLSLRVEKETMLALAKEGNIKAFSSKKIISLSTKFIVFITFCFVLIALIIILLLVKDLNYIIMLMSKDQNMGYAVVIEEILYAFGVLLVGTIAVALQFSSNLKLVINYQLKAFKSVEMGDYKVSVPVVTRDEFSMIADGTNHMITGLQEKEKIKSAFGKYMSPTVAQSILESEKGTSLGGRLVNVAVMFIDIRNYTSVSEKISPQEIVALLNAYFSLIVKCVHQHHGVVDKFIGDAAMAVFGLDVKEHSEDDALQAAFEVIRLLPELNESLQSRNLPPIGIGIGIHAGPAVAGNIGSDERLEYTVIGDTVNIASRLESLTKELKSQIAVSDAAYQALSPELKSQLTYKGTYPLKGKSCELAVYA